MKNKKTLNILFVILMLFSLGVSAIKYVNADSGFDTSYDGGGSSSSYDSSSSGSGGSSGNPFPVFAICCIIIFISTKVTDKKTIQKNVISNKRKYHSINDDSLKKINSKYTISSLKDITLSSFKNSRYFISSNDIDGLKSITSREQIESYLKTIKNIKSMNLNLGYKKIKFLDIIVFDIKEENNKVIIKTYLNIYTKCALINKYTKKRKKYRCHEALILELIIGDKVIINREETIAKEDAYSKSSKISQGVFLAKKDKILCIFGFSAWFLCILLLAFIFNDILSLLALFIIFKLSLFWASHFCNSNKIFINQAYDYYDLTDEEIKIYLKDYDSEMLKREAFIIYNDIQTAWMNFDYHKLRELCTDELYNAYKSQLETLKLKHRKNIMEDITYINSRVLNIEVINNTVNVDLYMTIKMKDYIINEKSGAVERGNSKRYLLLGYKMTIVKGIDSKELNCPNCGAKIDLNTSTRCEYCGSTIVIPPKKFVLSKKSLE